VSFDCGRSRSIAALSLCISAARPADTFRLRPKPLYSGTLVFLSWPLSWPLFRLRPKPLYSGTIGSTVDVDDGTFRLRPKPLYSGTLPLSPRRHRRFRFDCGRSRSIAARCTDHDCNRCEVSTAAEAAL